MTTVWLLWSLYATSQVVLGHYRSQADCQAQRDSVMEQVAQSRRPVLVCIVSEQW